MNKINKKIKKELKGIVLLAAIFGAILGAIGGYILKQTLSMPHDEIIIVYKLQGEEIVKLNLHETYNELGVDAKINETSYVDKVVTTGIVNVDKVGTYIVTYTLQDDVFNAVLTRTVIVMAGDSNG